MLELFQGFGLDSWSMCDVVLPTLKECFPSCVGVLTPRYVILLCLTGSRVRCVSPSCLWSKSMSVTNTDRLGDVVGILGWRNASVVCACLTGLCFCVWSCSGSHAALHGGKFEKCSFSAHPHASRIFKWTHWRDENLSSLS